MPESLNKSTYPPPPLAPEAWLQHGQALEAAGRAAAAVAAYDRAITWHRASLPATDLVRRRALGVALMNRGNALQKIAGPDALAESIQAYDEAIVLFEMLPIETEPAFRNHLGAAWLNRGHALLAAPDSASALVSFEHAVRHFEKLPLEANPFYRLNLAGAWTNLAHAQLSIRPSTARTSAQTALALLAESEGTAVVSAEMSLRARRALVAALGELLVTAETVGEPIDPLATEASDAIDDGLALARAWENRGTERLRPLATRLFRFGAQLYRVHQPHFLAEFILENLRSGAAFAHDPAFHRIAAESLAAALSFLERPRRLIVGAAADEKLLATVRSLRAVRAELSAGASAAVLSPRPEAVFSRSTAPV